MNDAELLSQLDPMTKAALRQFVSACVATKEKREAERAARSRKNGQTAFEGRASIIIHETATTFGISPQELTSSSRNRHTARARQTVMYLIRRHLSWSSPQIAKACGRKDHTTVLHGWRAVERLLQQDEVFRNVVLTVSAKCRKLLGGNGANAAGNPMHNAEALGTMREALEAYESCAEHGREHLLVCGQCLTQVQCALCEPAPCGCGAKQTC